MIIGMAFEVFRVFINQDGVVSVKLQIGYLQRAAKELNSGKLTENKSNDLQGGGLEPGTTRLQAQRLNHSATFVKSPEKRAILCEVKQ